MSKSAILISFFALAATAKAQTNSPVTVNQKAPVLQRSEIFIQASPEKVWKLLTEISNWSTWQPAINKAALNGPLQSGTTFRWKTGGMNINSRLHTVNEFSRFGWTGRSMGTYAVHNWTLLPENGGTVVTVEESLQGLLASLFKRSLSKTMQQGNEDWLKLLKSEAENKL